MSWALVLALTVALAFAVALDLALGEGELSLGVASSCDGGCGGGGFVGGDASPGNCGGCRGGDLSGGDASPTNCACVTAAGAGNGGLSGCLQLLQYVWTQGFGSPHLLQIHKINSSGCMSSGGFVGRSISTTD